ncbi:DUF2520 domain-containing protein [Maribacter sp. PR1]|uniref:Rossmann-like and DUF2520 domain-containing protein n=1 Tax=Maribacter cobaltidurans TaxID=1178778 RepID=A0ABU7IT36_9FLAO|nr:MULTISPECIES: Rossmann-like and DUF2520 domain-containing protein [Maribacter]MDC6388646.1 DUF2520 domain-containing protein [Maribacter sp. PR1]MEE1976035.1 Rossmann-like and DUF2520 domain-containing protein [Maribacter cobaltidurans]
MISVVILGTGNVAQNLFEALIGTNDINIIEVVGRSDDSLSYFQRKSKVSTDWDNPPKADIYIIAVTDDAIKEVSDKINVSGLVVHTSGSVSLSTLSKHKKRGVFYPLQTFTSGKLIDFNEVPLCLETHRKKDFKILNTLGGKISSNVQVIDSEKRRVLHVAAVFVNNFTNYMYSIGNDICSASDLDFSILYPLIRETANKIEYLSPYSAQTGPAKRNDLDTLHKHLNFLKDKKQRAIYKLLSNAIKASNEKEL